MQLREGLLTTLHAGTGQFTACVGEREAVARLLQLLDTARTRTRPAYDGAVLASHGLGQLAQLVRAVRRYSWQDKLEQLVAGVLDIAQLVRGQHGTSGGLEEDLRAATGRQVSCDWSRVRILTCDWLQAPARQLMSEARARSCLELVTQLVPAPSYTSLYRAWARPLTSAQVSCDWSAGHNTDY